METQRETRPYWGELPKLKAWRERQGLSLTDLAISVGITKATLSRIETGQRRPSVDTALALEEVTGIKRWHFRPDLWAPRRRA